MRWWTSAAAGVLALAATAASGTSGAGQSASQTLPSPVVRDAPVVGDALVGDAGPSGGGRTTGTAGRLPLHGITVVVDPGHQLGNARHPRQISRQVPAGGFTKPCNTTGTATSGGYPEATFAFRVSRRLRAQLERLGARVVLSRYRNSYALWGPCVDERGRLGNRMGADVKVSVHGDGSTSGRPGFHVIAPTDRAPWTSDIYRPSRRLAYAIKRDLLAARFPVAGYVAGGDGIDFRSDLATLNLSNIPTVLVECGNLRSRHDAAVMTSRHGQYRYAHALARGIRAFLHLGH